MSDIQDKRYDENNKIAKGLASFITRTHNTLEKMCEENTPMTKEVLEELTKEWVDNAYVLVQGFRDDIEDGKEFLTHEYELHALDFPDAGLPSWVRAESRSQKIKKAYASAAEATGIDLNSSVIVTETEKDLQELKAMYETDFCYFEENFGRCAALKFDYGFFFIRHNLALIKKILKGKDGVIRGTLVLESNLSSSEKNQVFGFMACLPQNFEQHYNYDFFCKWEECFNNYAARMFKAEDILQPDKNQPGKKINRAYYAPQNTAEELIAYIIFEKYGQALDACLLEIEGFKWSESDYKNGIDNDTIFSEYAGSKDLEKCVYCTPKEFRENRENLPDKYRYENWFK